MVGGTRTLTPSCLDKGTLAGHSKQQCSCGVGSFATSKLSVTASVTALCLCARASSRTMPIEISKDLIEQLLEENGRSLPRAAPQPGAHPPSFSKHVQDLDPRTRAQIANDKRMAGALTTSRSVGGALVKHEEEELAKIRAFAAQVLDDDQAKRRRIKCCEAEREACLSCYQRFPGEELQCASAVQAYDECAREFLLRRHTGR